MYLNLTDMMRSDDLFNKRELRVLQCNLQNTLDTQKLDLETKE